MRVGIIGIAVYNPEHVPVVNRVLSEHNEIILGRMGLPIREQGCKLISLMVEGNTDCIGKIAGSLGGLKGVRIKSMLL